MMSLLRHQSGAKNVEDAARQGGVQHLAIYAIGDEERPLTVRQPMRDHVQGLAVQAVGQLPENQDLSLRRANLGHARDDDRQVGRILCLSAEPACVQGHAGACSSWAWAQKTRSSWAAMTS